MLNRQKYTALILQLVNNKPPKFNLRRAKIQEIFYNRIRKLLQKKK